MGYEENMLPIWFDAPADADGHHSCHGNQNQILLDRYKDFRQFVEKRTAKGFHITKDAGIFLCRP